MGRDGSAAPLEILLQVAAATSTVTVIDSTEYQVEAISSATKMLTPSRDIPQTITVVTKEQIKDQSLQSITDVVTYIPGISSHQGESNRDQIIIRGNSTTADFRADAAIFFNITERWRLQVNAENLFDQRHYPDADGNNNISPGPSRAVRLGLRVSF